MKVIFLDIDGVLNWDKSKACFYDPETNLTYLGIDKARVRRLADIVRASAAKIVLVTDWKEDFEIGAYKQEKKHAKYLNNKLREFDLKVYDKTMTEIKTYNRGVNIIRWLDKHPEVTEYIIIDDSFFKYSNISDPRIEEHFIKTVGNFKDIDELSGLTDGLVPIAVGMLHGIYKGIRHDPAIEEEIRKIRGR